MVAAAAMAAGAMVAAAMAADVTTAVEVVAPASHTPSLLKRAFGVATDEAVAAVVIAVAAVVSAKQQWNHWRWRPLSVIGSGTTGWWGWPQLELVVGSIAHSVDWPQRSKPRLPSKALNGCGVRAAAAAAGGGAKVNPLIPSIGKAILHSRVPTSSASAIRFLRFRCFSKSPPPRPVGPPVTTQDTVFSEICVARSRSTGVEHGAFCLWGGGSKIIIQQFFFVTAIP